MKIKSNQVDDEFLYKIFHDRCPKCKRWAVTIHELEPRSRGEKSLRITNRTPICAECHAEFHRRGASVEQITEWHDIIYRFLLNIGTWELYNARERE